MRRNFLLAGLTIFTAAQTFANLEGVFAPGRDHPAIQCHTRPTNDPVAKLNRDIEEGKVQLKFDATPGYLRSVLDALKIPVESQIFPFSKTSVPSYRITPKNPRTLFFNDSVTVGWVRGGFIEVASESPEQGVFFYTLPQKPVDKPQFTRLDDSYWEGAR